MVVSTVTGTTPTTIPTSARAVCLIRSNKSNRAGTQPVSGPKSNSMRINKSVFCEILASFPSVPPECGGILGQKNGIICAYLHDRKWQSTESAIYVPDVDWMNRCIQEWAFTGIEFAGIVHSHPLDCNTLSEADRAYICQIMTAIPAHIMELFFPILIPGEDMYAYSATRSSGNVTIKPVPITFIKPKCTNSILSK